MTSTPATLTLWSLPSASSEMLQARCQVSSSSTASAEVSVGTGLFIGDCGGATFTDVARSPASRAACWRRSSLTTTRRMLPPRLFDQSLAG